MLGQAIKENLWLPRLATPPHVLFEATTKSLVLPGLRQGCTSLWEDRQLLILCCALICTKLP
jgi:hypothetical protein